MQLQVTFRGTKPRDEVLTRAAELRQAITGLQVLFFQANQGFQRQRLVRPEEVAMLKFSADCGSGVCVIAYTAADGAWRRLFQ